MSADPFVVDTSATEFVDQDGNALMVLRTKGGPWENVVDGSSMHDETELDDAEEEGRSQGYAEGIENFECDHEDSEPLQKLLDDVINHIGPEPVREMARLDPRAADLLRSIRPDIY